LHFFHVLTDPPMRDNARPPNRIFSQMSDFRDTPDLHLRAHLSIPARESSKSREPKLVFDVFHAAFCMFREPSCARVIGPRGSKLAPNFSGFQDAAVLGSAPFFRAISPAAGWQFRGPEISCPSPLALARISGRARLMFYVLNHSVNRRVDNSAS